MNTIEQAEAAIRGAITDLSDALRCHALHITPSTGTLERSLSKATDALKDLLAEHKRVLTEMHQRELHHFETEQMLTEAGIDPDAAPRPTVDERALVDYLSRLAARWGSEDAALAVLLSPEEARLVATLLLSRFNITPKEQS